MGFAVGVAEGVAVGVAVKRMGSGVSVGVDVFSNVGVLSMAGSKNSCAPAADKAVCVASASGGLDENRLHPLRIFVNARTMAV